MPTEPVTPTAAQRPLFAAVQPRVDPAPPKVSPPFPQRSAVRRRLILAAALLLGLLGLEIYRVTGGPNWHVVIPDQVYRSAQLSEVELAEAVRRFGLKSVINLRGECPETDWFQWEQRVLTRLGVRHFNVNLSTYEPPSPLELRRLTDDLRTCPKPVLIHCRRGSDRTSLAAAIAQLLLADASLDQAERQLSLRFGHMPFGKVQFLDEAYADYRAWLGQRGWEHAPDRWVRFVREDYRPGPYWAEIEPLEVPKQLKLGQWGTARFRVHNRSHKPWHFRKAAHVGIHLHYYLKRLDEQRFTAGGGAGYWDHVVPPGGSTELTLAIAPQREAGTYEFFVDLADEQVCYFFMVDSPPFKTTVEVVP